MSDEPWEQNAPYWTRIIRERRDRYRTELTDPALLSAIGACEGLTVLDAGCGEGYLTREMTSRGARVVAIDKSWGLIKEANGYQPRAGAYARASVEALPLPDETLDLVVCNHVFSHLEDVRSAIAEFGRVLRTGGRLVALTLHPCFYAANAERGVLSGLPAAVYFSNRGIEQRFCVDGLESPAAITSWLRPLETYVRAMTEAGFVIADLREPRPSEAQLSDTWWREGFPTALFILLVARKT